MSGRHAAGQTATSAAAAGRYHGRAGSTRLAKLCIAFVVFHLAMTVLYLAPTPAPLRSLATRYMEPVFKQSWWVFAPDPVSSNTYLLVRAKKADGTLTPWFNITACDISQAIHHHPVPDRRYLSTFQMMRHLEIGRDNLPKAAQNVITQDVTGENWVATQRQRLVAAGGTTRQADAFLTSERATNNLASLVARSRWGTNLTQIQVQEKIVHTRPFDERNTNVPLVTDIWQPGFMPITGGTADEDAMIDSLYGPKAGC